jgi:hypothetical protein
MKLILTLNQFSAVHPKNRLSAVSGLSPGRGAIAQIKMVTMCYNAAPLTSIRVIKHPAVSQVVQQFLIGQVDGCLLSQFAQRRLQQSFTLVDEASG